MLTLRNHVIESKQFDREFSIQLSSWCEKIVALYFKKGIILSCREKSKFMKLVEETFCHAPFDRAKPMKYLRKYFYSRPLKEADDVHVKQIQIK